MYLPDKHRPTCKRRRRAGYLFVAVLLTTLVVATMGLAALSAASLRMRTVVDANDWTQAQLLAQSAIEDALLTLKTNNGWRTSHVEGKEYPISPTTLGTGTYSWRLEDEDGNLSDDDSDSVRLVGIGRVGRAVAAQSVRLLSTGSPITCLESAAHCEGNITLGAAVQFKTDQHISSNGNISASGFLTQIEGNAEASGTVSGTVIGKSTNNVLARRLPGSSVFDYYLDNGSSMAMGSIPLVGGIRTIEKQSIGPLANPYGEKNAEGIYILLCEGTRIRIRDSRIVGTLVLVNPGTGSSIEGSLAWEAAVRNYPALLVSGSLVIRTTEFALSESVTNTNFNPTALPSEGTADADITDSYPSEINGLVYVSGLFDAQPDLLESQFRGVTVCGTMNANSGCRFNYRQIFLDRPPPGFAKGNPMAVSPGSLRREAMP